MRVLVIEDDRETAQFLQRSLRESGHTADVAGDGEVGLAMAREGGYDVLIVDRMLPKREGLSVVQTLRAEGARKPLTRSSTSPSAERMRTGVRSPSARSVCTTDKPSRLGSMRSTISMS